MTHTFNQIFAGETRIIQEIALNALQTAFAGTNIVVTPERGTFESSGNNCGLKFQFARQDANGAVASREADTFRQLCGLYGLQETDLGRAFTYQNRAFKLVGINGRARRAAILCERSDGKRFRFTVDAVKSLLK